jgi:hypothetical protein
MLRVGLRRCWSAGQNPQPEKSLVDEGRCLQVSCPSLGTHLTGQELGGNIVVVGCGGRIPLRQIMQGQGADLDTGFMDLPLRMTGPETASPFAAFNRIAHSGWSRV